MSQDVLDGIGMTTIVGKGWSAKVPAKVAQQMKDGAALQRLREELPEGRVSVIVDDGASVMAFDGQHRVVGGGSHRAATIAEAADKCREAVSPPPSSPQTSEMKCCDWPAHDHPEREST